MTAIDLEDFAAWLRARGVAEQHLPLYREGAEAVLRQVDAADDGPGELHVEAAVQAAAQAGGSPRRLDNLRAIGARLLAYADEQRAAAPAGDPPPDDEPLLELADVPRGDSRFARLKRLSQQQAAIAEGAARGTMVDDLVAAAPVEPAMVDAAMPPRAALAPAITPAPAPARPAGAVPFSDGPRPGVMASATGGLPVPPDQRPLPGCACRTRQDTYPDDYWSMWGKVYLVVAGSVGLVVALFFSVLASTVIGLAIGATGAIATGLTAGWRCTDCRRWIARRGLDAEQRRNVHTRTAFFVGLGALLSVGFALGLHRLKQQAAEERRMMRELRDLRDLDELDVPLPANLDLDAVEQNIQPSVAPDDPVMEE